jgi:hypothetical protein
MKKDEQQAFDLGKDAGYHGDKNNEKSEAFIALLKLAHFDSYNRLQMCWNAGFHQGQLDQKDAEIASLGIALGTARARIESLERQNEILRKS